MRSLVTGGAGFIGSHLVTALIERGQQVTVIDNFSTGRPTNLGHLDGSPLLSVVEADVADLAAIRPHLHGVDWAFHLAGLADIVPSISQPLAYHHSNVDGTAAVLEAARQGGVRRFMYAASSTCYGRRATPSSGPSLPSCPSGR